MHDMGKLFKQLGLGHSDGEIDQFIAAVGPLPPHIALHEASLWSPAQARFLHESMLEDADWTCVIEQLDARLR